MERIDANLRKSLSGISGILVTPFDEADHIAPARLRPIVDRAVAAGVHMLVANGNTGEFYGLTTAEAEKMVHAAAEMVGGRVPLIGGVGKSVGDACALARASRAAGAQVLMVHQPPDPFAAPAVWSSTSSASPMRAAACRSCSIFATMRSASMRSRR